MKIVLSHRYLDFDALASMVAVQKIYPDAYLVLEGKTSSVVEEFLALAKEQLPYYKFKDIDLKKVEKIILVDTHDLGRSVGSSELVEKLKKLNLEIYDHHPYSAPRQENIIVQPVGACTTLLVEKIIKLGIRLTSFEATLMTLGIYDDTGSLLFENTTSRDVLAVAYLLEQGAQLSVVAEYLRKPLTMEQMELFRQLLDNGITEKFQGLPVYISFAQSREYFDGLALLAHRIGEIQNADVWFLVVKMENRVYIVGRSRGNGLAVNKIVEVFGGSGHEKAASATLKDAEIEDVISRLKEEILKRVQLPSLVRDIMSFPVKTVSPDTKMEEVGKMLLRYGHTGVPVVDNDKLVGVISRRDVDKALKHGLKHAPVKGFMTKDVITVGPDADWEQVQKLMVQHDIGRLPVVEDGKLVGIVSRSDVLRLVYGSVVPTTRQLVRERSKAMRDDVLDLIRRLPDNLRFLLEAIRDTACELDSQVYLVGGFVRDLFLGVPTQDLDVVVEGDGLKFAENLNNKLDSQKLTLHKSFGTARLTLNDGTHIDIAGTRREEYAFPGALPTVEESTLKEDLFRRDFTINAMALCLNSGCFGEVIDYYGGLRDLQQGEIRFLHNLSFIDDPIRILRAIRFSCRYRFKLAKVTRDGIKTALQANVFEKVSPERFTEELFLIYGEPRYQDMGKQLVQYEIFKYWFGGNYPWNFDENEQKIKDWSVEKRWLLSLKNMDDNEILNIINHLKMTKPLQKNTLDYIRIRSELKGSTLDIVKVDELLLDASDLLLEVLLEHEKFKEIISNYRNIVSKIQTRVTGSTLKELGFKEGPEIGEILRKLRNYWLKGKITSSVEEEKYLRKLISKRKEISKIQKD